MSLKTISRCSGRVKIFWPRLRETCCFNTCMANESFLTRGLPIRRWKCSGITPAQLAKSGRVGDPGHHIAGDNELVLSAHLFQDVQKNVAATHGIEKLLSPVTTTGDEVPVASMVKPPQTCWHDPSL